MEQFPSEKEGTELLRYYFLEAIRLFEEGFFEMSFFSTYKVIREPTVVDPKKSLCWIKGKVNHHLF